MPSLWETAKVAEPIGLSGSEHAGAFILNANEATILSLNPAEDFEINTNVVQGWKLLFMDGEQVLGELEYNIALEKLQPYKKDEQNGSILIKALTHDEIEGLVNV